MLSMLTSVLFGRVLPDLCRRSGISLGGGRVRSSPIMGVLGFIWTGVLGATIIGGTSLGCCSSFLLQLSEPLHHQLQKAHQYRWCRQSNRVRSAVFKSNRCLPPPVHRRQEEPRSDPQTWTASSRGSPSGPSMDIAPLVCSSYSSGPIARPGRNSSYVAGSEDFVSARSFRWSSQSCVMGMILRGRRESG